MHTVKIVNILAMRFMIFIVYHVMQFIKSVLNVLMKISNLIAHIIKKDSMPIYTLKILDWSLIGKLNRSFDILPHM
jgi:hypothetical protein